MAQFPEKAYKNLDFLNSPAARSIRIMCEYEETRQRFLNNDIHNTIVFFGSARTRSGEDATKLLAEAEEAAAKAPGDEALQTALRKAQATKRMSVYYDGARELSKRLTVWSMERNKGRKYVVSTGGGPGIMEAGNRGAHDVGGKSVGLGISLPFEQGINDYVSPELGFEFHYFFTRKLWFLYLCKAMVVFPGGFGTMDELFETVTLVQTGKIKRPLPIVLFGVDYWDAVFNVQAMADFGTISPGDPDLMYRTNSVDDAFAYLTERLDGIDQVGAV